MLSGDSLDILVCRNMDLMFGAKILGKDMHMEVTIIEMTFGTIWEVETYMCREDEVCD